MGRTKQVRETDSRPSSEVSWTCEAPVRPQDGAPLELDVESFVGFSRVFLIPLPSGEMKDCVRAVQMLAGLLKYPDPS